MSMQHTTTQRGFALSTFTDQYGEACSLQESSLATEACVWLGIDEVPAEQGITASGRMHLTQDMAAALVVQLQHFVATGALPPR